MTTVHQPRWAHDDPKVLAFLRRIGTATAAADRDEAREEMAEFLQGPGRHLQMDLAEFARGAQNRVDREAWDFEAPDAARTVPQWKTDHRMRTDYLRYIELIDHAGHGENEYDREQFARRAEELREYWEMTAPHDWAAMRELHQMWQTDPENARQFTASELRHNPVPNRHLVAAQQAFDPHIREHEQWREMHNQVADLNGELMAARSEDEARQIDARIQALREDRSAWPKSWHKFEEDAATDMEFQREQSERSTERYFEVIDQKAPQTPDLSRSTLTPEQEEDVDELEESPW